MDCVTLWKLIPGIACSAAVPVSETALLASVQEDTTSYWNKTYQQFILLKL